MSLPIELDRLADDRDHMTLRRRSARGTAITFGAQGVRFIVQFASQVMLANLLLPSDFGLIAMVSPILYLSQVFNDLGLMQATVQREEITHAELQGLFWINMLVSLGLASTMVLIAPVVAWIYGEPRLGPVTVSLAVVLILIGLSAQPIALLTRRMRLLALSIIDVSCILVASVIGLVAARMGAAYWALVLMQAANAAVIAALAWIYSGWRPSLPRRGIQVGALLKFGSYVAGLNIATYAGYNVPLLLIGLFFDSTSLGLYDRGFRLVVVPLWQLNTPLDRIGTALLSRLRGADTQYRKAYSLMLHILLSLTVPGFVWAATMSPILVPRVLGSAWAGAVPIVTWLAISVILAPLTMSASWLFMSQGRSKEQLRYGIARNLVAVMAALCGLYWGAIGVAIAATIFAPLMHGISAWGITRRGPITIYDLVRAGYPILAGGCVAAVVLGGLARWNAELSLSSSSLLLVATLPLAYAICVATALCTVDGRCMFRSIWESRSLSMKFSS